MQPSIRGNLGWMMVTQVGLVLLQFGSSVITARLLSPHEMGVFAVGIAVVGILGAVRAFGLVNFVIRELDLEQDTLASTFTINALLAIATAAITVLFSYLGGHLMNDAGVRRVLLVLAVIPLISIFDFLPAAMLERTGRFRILAVVNLTRSFIAATTTVLLAYSDFSYMSMAWGNLTAGIAGAVIVNIVGRSHASLCLSLRDWRRITQFGTQMLTISLTGNIAARLSELALGQLAGLSALGLYSRASGLNSLLWENVHLVVGRIVFVEFSNRKRDLLPLSDTYLQIVALVTALLWPAFIGMALVSGPLIRVVYGPTWTPAAAPLALLSIASAILVAVTMAGEIYIVSGQTKKQVRYELKRTATGVVLFICGCFAGLVWASLARVAEAICTIAYCKRDLKCMTQTQGAKYGLIYQQSGLLTILACTPTAVLMATNAWSAETSFPLVMFTIAVGAVAWFVGIWRFGHPLYHEAMRILNYLWPKALLPKSLHKPASTPPR